MPFLLFPIDLSCSAPEAPCIVHLQLFTLRPGLLIQSQEVAATDDTTPQFKCQTARCLASCRYSLQPAKQNVFKKMELFTVGSLGISAWDFCMQETKRKQAYVFSAILTRAS